MTEQFSLDLVNTFDMNPAEWTSSHLAASKQLAEKVQKLQADIPKTSNSADQQDNAWPMAYIDPSLVAKGEILSAPIPLSYLEGYPTADGVPFWERLENEPIEYFKLFKCYRDMKEINGIRSVPEVAKLSTINSNILMRIGVLYHWQIRSKAYDAYKIAENHARTTRQTESILKEHTETATKLRQVAMRYLKDNADALTPKTAIDMMKLAVEMERLSIGLEPNKTSNQQANSHSHPTINITSNTLNTNPSEGNILHSNTDANDRVSQILNVLHQSGALAAHTNTRKEVGDSSND